MEIRSYRRVFDLERRVYSIDSMRLNPAGVPVRGIVYFGAILTVAVVVARLPLIGGLIRALPWYLRELALPGIAATVLSVLRIEGRTFHLAAGALLRFCLEPRQLARLSRCEPVGQRWYPEEILVLPDGSDARMRRMRFTGPGAVRVSVEHDRAGKGLRRTPAGLAATRLRAALVLSQHPEGRALDRGQIILLGPGTRMLVRAGVGRSGPR
jgi:hypothetical protein